MKQKIALEALLIFSVLCASAQEFYYNPAAKKVPVFLSRADSIQFNQVDSVLQEHLKKKDYTINLDSLFIIRRTLLQERISGYQKVYSSGSMFTSLSQIIENGSYENARHVSIGGEEINKLPKELYECTHIEVLELINTSISKLPGKLDALPSLKTVYLVNNQPKGKLKVKHINNLKKLVVRGTEPEDLPRTFKRLKKLTVLDLAETGLNTMPRGIQKNKQLKELILQENEIELSDIKKYNLNRFVEKIDLQKNKISLVPIQFGEFKSLKKLLLNYNEVNKIQITPGQLTSLEELSFYNNKLTEVPEFIYHLNSLREIDLYYNQIERIDSRIGDLKNLEVVYLSNNKLISIPESIGDLPNLRELYLHNNRISELPTSIGNVGGLKILRINNNNFGDLPMALTNLTQLENLDVSNNQLRFFSLDVEKLTHLKILSMVNNPFLPELRKKLTEQAELLKSRDVIVHLDSF